MLTIWAGRRSKAAGDLELCSQLPGFCRAGDLQGRSGVVWPVSGVWCNSSLKGSRREREDRRKWNCVRRSWCAIVLCEKMVLLVIILSCEVVSGSCFLPVPYFSAKKKRKTISNNKTEVDSQQIGRIKNAGKIDLRALWISTLRSRDVA